MKHLNNTVKDTRTKKVYSYASDMVGLLNEQQTTINKQSDEISYWKHRINSLLWILHKLEEQETIKSLIKEIDRDDFNLELKWWEEIYEANPQYSDIFGVKYR